MRTTITLHWGSKPESFQRAPELGTTWRHMTSVSSLSQYESHVHPSTAAQLMEAGLQNRRAAASVPSLAFQSSAPFHAEVNQRIYRLPSADDLGLFHRALDRLCDHCFARGANRGLQNACQRMWSDRPRDGRSVDCLAQLAAAHQLASTWDRSCRRDRDRHDRSSSPPCPRCRARIGDIAGYHNNHPQPEAVAET